MLEQEMASIIKHILENAASDPPAPYYWNVPQHFVVPAVFFPPLEVDTGGETLSTYSMDFTWYIKLFDRTAQGAYRMGSSVVQAIRGNRNLIPLVAQDGSIIERAWIRVKDPSLRVLDDGAAQLTISWRSCRPYKNDIAELAQTFNLDMFSKSGNTISDAYAKTLERYAVPAQETRQTAAEKEETI